jgi:hypothetical protein
MKWAAIYSRYFFKLNDDQAQEWMDEFNECLSPKATDEEIIDCIRQIGGETSRPPRAGDMMRIIINNRKGRKNSTSGCKLCEQTGWITVCGYMSLHDCAYPCICEKGKQYNKTGGSFNPKRHDLVWNYVKWVAELDEDAEEMKNGTIWNLKNKINETKKEKEEDE